MNPVFSIKEAIHKIEHFCAYQESCHEEVVQKLRTMKMDSEEIDIIMAHLISDNFLNEERFACSFARGKHRIKQSDKIMLFFIKKILILYFKKLSLRTEKSV
jgi:regulatory protein